MSYYRICPSCGSHLDPGEICDCKLHAASSSHSRERSRDSPRDALPHTEEATTEAGPIEGRIVAPSVNTNGR